MASAKIVRKIISSNRAPKPVGPYNQAVLVDRTLYMSGVLGMDANTGKLVAGGAAEEARQALTNMKNILEDSGSCLGRVVKATIFLTNMDDFAGVNEVYKQHFTSNFPARSTVQVAKLPLNAKFEIEAIAVTGDVQTIA